jgi:nucleotide-binding universal stress UspA family protein
MVVLDGSRFAETAIPAAHALARSAHADLRLVHVPGPARPSTPGAGTQLARLVPTHPREGDSAPAASLGITGPEPAAAPNSAKGSTVEGLMRGIRETRPDLVVMASGGKGTGSSVAAATVAEELILATTAPVLLVGKGGVDPRVPQGATWPRTLLAPVDLTRDPDPVMDALVDFARVTQAHVTLLNVVDPSGPPSAPEPAVLTGRQGRKPEERRWRALNDLDRLADRLRARGVRAAARVVVGHDVAAAILGELEQGRADLVAMSPRATAGRSSHPRRRMTEAVVRGASKPVLVVPVAETRTTPPDHWERGPGRR